MRKKDWRVGRCAALVGVLLGIPVVLRILVVLRIPVVLRIQVVWLLIGVSACGAEVRGGSAAWGGGAAEGIESGGNGADGGETTRIVSLVPNLTELTFALGAGDQVVGVSDFCRFPPEARERPAVGGLVNPSLEGVLSLRPTVVLLYRSQTDFARKLAQLGVRTVMFQADRLADLFGSIDKVGVLTGMTSASAELAQEIRSGLDAVRQRGAVAEGDRVRGVVIVSRDPAGLRNLFQASETNFLGELFQVAGGELAVQGDAAVNREKIILANPDLIVDMSGSAAGGPGISGTTRVVPQRDAGPWEVLSTVAAVRQGQVYRWADAHAMLLGPSVVETARRMRELIAEAERENAGDAGEGEN